MNLDNLILYGLLPLIGAAIIFAIVRMIRGPAMPDRVVALDLLATLGIGVMAMYAIATDQAVFLDAATVLALIAFLGTVAFAYYLQKRA